MKHIRTITKSQYRLVTDDEAKTLVGTEEWVYTSKGAYRAFMNRTKKRYPAGSFNHKKRAIKQLEHDNKLRTKHNNRAGKGTIRLQRIEDPETRKIVKTIKHPVKHKPAAKIAKVKKYRRYCKVCGEKKLFVKRTRPRNRVCIICERKQIRGRA